MRWSVGTSGYSYKEWRGPFYPAGLSPADMLGFYAARLPAVEINNTFYRLPKSSVLSSWAEQVPEDFRFSIKASRRITHFKRLAGAHQETDYLLGCLDALGARLGAVLFQLPPKLAVDLERLDAFLAGLPEGTRAAFEFRHPSWLEVPVLERLRARNLALVAVDSEGADPPELVETASWGYVRLRRAAYTGAELEEWVHRLRAPGWDEAFVFFKHEDAGAGPRLASGFLEVAQLAEQQARPLRRARRERSREAG